MACPALISLTKTHPPRQWHWWLPDGGFPQALASLLGSPLQASGHPPRTWQELRSVFAPLAAVVILAERPCSNAPPPPAALASYCYRIQWHGRGSQVCCWRRYPDGLGWQRRCGPMPLARFITRFAPKP